MPEVEAVIGVDRRPPKVELARTEFVRVSRLPLAHPPDRPRRGDRHGRRHPARRGLDRHHAAPGPREQRHRDDERSGRLRRPRLARAQGRVPLQHPRLRRRAGRPGLLHRGHAPAASARAAPSSGGSSTPSARSRTSPTATPTRPSPRCASPRGSARPCAPRSRELLRLPVVPMILGFDPRMQFVHEEDIVGCLEHAVRHDLPGAYNCAGDGVLALTEAISLLGKVARARPAAVGDRPGGGRAGARRGRADPARAAQAPALRPRRGQPQDEGRRLPLPLHDARDRPQARRAPAAGAVARTPLCSATVTRRRSRSSCAGAPASAATPTTRAASRAARRLASSPSWAESSRPWRARAARSTWRPAQVSSRIRRRRRAGRPRRGSPTSPLASSSTSCRRSSARAWRRLREHEREHAARRTVLAAIDALLEGDARRP